MYENWFGDWFGGWFDLSEGEEEFVNLFPTRRSEELIIYGSSASGYSIRGTYDEEEEEILMICQAYIYATY